MHWLGTLIPRGSSIEGLGKGIADISGIIGGQVPDLNPMNSVTTIPGLVKQPNIGGCAHYELVNSMGVCENEWTNLNLKYLGTGFGEFYFPQIAPSITTLEELKGLRVYARGGQADVAEALGMVPVAISGAEVHDAVQKGTLDGAVWAYGTVTRSIYAPAEIMKTFFLINSGAVHFPFAMNLDTWNSLPADIQGIIADPVFLQYEFPNIWYVLSDLRATERGKEIMKLHPELKEVSPTAAEKATIKEKLMPLSEDWVKEWAGDGPSQQVYDKWIELLEKWEAFYTYEIG